LVLEMLVLVIWDWLILQVLLKAAMEEAVEHLEEKTMMA